MPRSQSSHRLTPARIISSDIPLAKPSAPPATRRVFYDRAEWLLFTAEGIRKPDEIWKEQPADGVMEMLYYLTRFDVGKKHPLGCISVFERETGSAALWRGVTNYAALRDQSYWEGKRGRDRQSLKYWRYEEA